jgi:hypothetical protein
MSLYEKLGDRRALDALDSVLGVLRGAAAEFEGRVVKTLGDEIMAVFPSAAAAARAAASMQIRVAGLPAFGGTRLGVRIGFHAGPVLEAADDVFGDAVNMAARMAGLAKGGQIVTTGSTVEALPQPVRESTRDLDRLAVKGKQKEVRIFELLWQDDADLTVLGTRGALLPAAAPRLRLEHAGRTLAIGPELPTVLVGRDKASHIVIAHRSASRLHGRIERRRDQYFYTDLSTNGTYVAIAGDAEILLRREQIMLRGQGWLAYGHPSGDARAEAVRFYIESVQGGAPT